MKIFTITAPQVTSGALIETFTIKGVGVKIPAILIGEEGRGRKLGVLAVQLLPESQKIWEEKGSVMILDVKLGETKSGATKLIEIEKKDGSGMCVAVLRTGMGFRGSNAHQGDVAEEIENVGFDGEPAPTTLKYHPFPAYSIICEGQIAEGLAGNMGSGTQLIATMHANEVFSTFLGGRMYGAPRRHFYQFNGTELVGGLTPESRDLSEVF